jgi:hypothetical protein
LLTCILFSIIEKKDHKTKKEVTINTNEKEEKKRVHHASVLSLCNAILVEQVEYIYYFAKRHVHTFESNHELK